MFFWPWEVRVVGLPIYTKMYPEPASSDYTAPERKPDTAYRSPVNFLRIGVAFS